MPDSIVDCELVISGRDTSALLDLVEEPFDETQPIVVRFAWGEREMDWQNDIEAAAY